MHGRWRSVAKQNGLTLFIISLSSYTNLNFWPEAYLSVTIYLHYFTVCKFVFVINITFIMLNNIQSIILSTVWSNILKIRNKVITVCVLLHRSIVHRNIPMGIQFLHRSISWWIHYSLLKNNFTPTICSYTFKPFNKGWAVPGNFTHFKWSVVPPDFKEYII